MGMFDLFTNTSYTFLTLAQGGVLGNTETESEPADGILKVRAGLTSGANSELEQSDATLHIKPSEPFISAVGGNLVGHGIRASKNGLETTYRITGMTEGFDFHTGTLEFYKLTLKVERLGA
jgi:hypothetical protein